ncbi:hypothetical protein [Ekhidna sp.]|uniref:hypothetical protein n=1 Tax=Ekhidna sp. TaxID=2608089 RepID=UPI0035181E40
MILKSDKVYKQTKQIILGDSKMAPLYEPLANWIDSTFNVKTVNIVHDYINGNKRPRLNIIFEFEKEKLKFNGKERFGYDSSKQKKIAGEFERLMKEYFDSKRPGLLNFFKRENHESIWKNLWVIFSSFEPVAKSEVNEKLPESRIKQLKNDIANPDIWEISRAFSGVTFFVHTDEQLKKYEKGTEKEVWRNQYFQLLKEYDEYNYFNLKTFNIYLDSKENFDNNYESSWFYYYR